MKCPLAIDARDLHSGSFVSVKAKKYVTKSNVLFRPED